MSITANIPQAGPAATEGTPALAADELARGLDAILLSLQNLLWTFARYTVLLGPLLAPVLTRINRTRQRLVRALAHVAAGRAPRPARKRPYAPRPPQPRDPLRHVPVRRHGWLAAMLDHQMRAFPSQLEILLARPGAAAIIASSPGALRTLRPLCRMIGAELPAALRLPPRPRRPRPEPAPKPAAPPPKAERPPGPGLLPGDRPFQPYVLKAVRFHKRTGLWRPWKPA